MADEYERRTEMAVKVAIVEERTLHNKHQLNRIEDLLVKHAALEESILTRIHTSLDDFRSEINTMIEKKITPLEHYREDVVDIVTNEMAPLKADLAQYKTDMYTIVETKIDPLEKDLAKYKNFITFAGGGGSILLVLLSIFKENILRLFGH